MSYDAEIVNFELLADDSLQLYGGGVGINKEV